MKIDDGRIRNLRPKEKRMRRKRKSREERKGERDREWEM